MGFGGVVLVLLQVSLSSSEEFYLHNIYINPLNGSDNDECYKSNSTHFPCRTLNHAFEYRNHSTRYIVDPDSNHTLTTSVRPFENLQSLAIVGGGGGGGRGLVSFILCNGSNGNIGLAFIGSSDVVIRDVILSHCAAARNSTSKNYNFETLTLYRFSVSLYFYRCVNVEMMQVTVAASPNATGVVMYDSTGDIVVANSVFSNNTVADSRVGGGGFYVEFTFCVPGDDNCSDVNYSSFVRDAHYSFKNSTFSNNTASNDGSNDNSSFILPYRMSHQAFGRGGGLSIFVKGKALNNSFGISNCTFEGNTAQWGGGFFVEFQDEAANNTVLVSNSTLSRNKCGYTLSGGTGGGGMRIGHYVYGFEQNIPDGLSGNRIEVDRCNFTSNSAMYGGGLSLSPTLQDVGPNVGKEAIFEVKNSIFTSNVGKIGAALHVGIFPLIVRGVMMKVMVLNCSFVRNTVDYASSIGMEKTPHTIGIGALYFNEVHVIFRGFNSFLDNVGTALVVAGSSVHFTRGTSNFTGNVGYRGGAVALLGATYILIDDKSRLYFLSNMATDKGGAIYNKNIEMDNLVTQVNCFVRHADPFLEPDRWNAAFFFSNNSDKNGHKVNSIHSSSILPCARGALQIADLKSIFCWRNWTYSNATGHVITDCSSQITSDAGNILLRNNLHHMNAIPGTSFELPLNITDDYQNDVIKDTVFSTTLNRTDTENMYFWGGNATLSGKENSILEMTMNSLGDRIWQVVIDVKLLPCPPGLKPSKDENGNETMASVCVCSGRYREHVLCDPISLYVRMTSNNWMGSESPGGEYLVGLCPPGFCASNTSSSYVNLPSTSDELSSRVCARNRTDVLCGKCLGDLEPAVNSETYDCVHCTSDYSARNVARYAASVYLPLFVLFTVLIIFDIRLTTGPVNAFILYSQIISSTFSLNADGQIHLSGSERILTDIYKFIYGIFNLEFIENLLEPFCISRNFNTLKILMLDYGVAMFPLFMIIFVVICLKINECCSCSRRQERARISVPYSSRRWRLSEALLPAFATYILLSYTKFSLTSSYIMRTQSLIREDGTYTSPARVYYAGQYASTDRTYVYAFLLPSIIIFAFVCIIPLILLVYPLKAFEWCLSRNWYLRRSYPEVKVRHFLDTFQGCYKINMRFFAGLYFLFRLTINVIYLATDSWLQQFIIQQICCIVMVTLLSVCHPYNAENNVFNYVDPLIFANLAVVNVLSLYLFTSSQNGQPISVSCFVVQYILVFLPLLYMIAYSIWYVAIYRQGWLRRKLLIFLRKVRLVDSRSLDYLVANGVSKTHPTRTEISIAETSQQQEEEFFARAEVTNRFQRDNGRENSISDDDTYRFDQSNADDLIGHRPSVNSRLRTTNQSVPGYGTISSNPNPLRDTSATR